jgi:hypothetical protein
MRAKPDLRVKNSIIHKPLDFISFLFIAVIGYLVFSAIIRYTSGSGSGDDRVICFGALICLVVFYLQSKEQEKRDEQKRMDAQKEWVRTSQMVEVAIISRDYNPGGRYEDGYYPGEYHTTRSSYHLELETIPEQTLINPKITSVGVNVSQDVYFRLDKRETVHIYYKPEKPFTFLLEEEL